MRKIYLMLLLVVMAFCLFGVQTANAADPDPLKMGTVLQRTNLANAPGFDAILVLREIPPGGASGKHTQAGNEVVYILEGSVTLEVDGKPAQTLKAGEAFTTAKGDVHNVKNASTTAPAKALAFYIAKKGAKMEDLSTPVH